MLHRLQVIEAQLDQLQAEEIKGENDEISKVSAPDPTRFVMFLALAVRLGEEPGPDDNEW